MLIDGTMLHLSYLILSLKFKKLLFSVNSNVFCEKFENDAKLVVCTTTQKNQDSLDGWEAGRMNG